MYKPQNEDSMNHSEKRWEEQELWDVGLGGRTDGNGRGEQKQLPRHEGFPG